MKRLLLFFILCQAIPAMGHPGKHLYVYNATQTALRIAFPDINKEILIKPDGKEYVMPMPFDGEIRVCVQEIGPNILSEEKPEPLQHRKISIWENMLRDLTIAAQQATDGSIELKDMFGKK